MTRRPRTPPTPPRTPPEPRRAAHPIAEGCETMDTTCDGCGERFLLDAQALRAASELELTCPYCQRALLVQHVEYAVAMLTE